MIAKGGYNGGSTIIGRGSSWFSKSNEKPEKRKRRTIAEIADAAQRSADRTRRKQAKSDAFFARLNDDKEGALKAARKRLARNKRKRKSRN